MKFKLLTALAVIAAIAGAFILSKDPQTVKAFGFLNVKLGVPSGDPIFEIENMLPGDCVSRTVEVENDGDYTTSIAVRSDNENDSDNLSQKLAINISNDDVLYEKTLEEFFDDSETLDGVFLSNLPEGEEIEYEFEICFNSNSGNEYQEASTSFDLIFGEVISPLVLPDECSDLTGIITFKIEGTEGDDEINGSRASELILGYGGNDEIDGKGGNDCIVGGEGDDDTLDGGTGEDIILGGLGNDILDGGSGDDFLDGGEGDDELDGGSGDDECINGEDVDSCEVIG